MTERDREIVDMCMNDKGDRQTQRDIVTGGRDRQRERERK